MILVVGGEASGRRAFVRGLGYAEEQIAVGILDSRPAVFRAERLAGTGASLEELADRLAQKEVVVCTELGCGVVPIGREQRLARETAGRLSILLARRAETVVRLVCGIPSVLKGEASSIGKPYCSLTSEKFVSCNIKCKKGF